MTTQIKVQVKETLLPRDSLFWALLHEERKLVKLQAWRGLLDRQQRRQRLAGFRRGYWTYQQYISIGTELMRELELSLEDNGVAITQQNIVLLWKWLLDSEGWHDLAGTVVLAKKEVFEEKGE